MRILPFLSLVLLALAGCKDVENITETDKLGGLKEYTVKKGTSIKHGPFTEYYPNQNLKEQANFVNDTLHGERKVFFENGKPDYLETYNMGQFEGPYKKYNEQGQIVQEGQYSTNEMSGTWKGWYDDGTLKEEVLFAKNNENGPFKEYHPNGKIMTEGSYLNGDNEQGPLVKYDENGQPTERMFCEYGVCGTVWSAAEGDVKLDTMKLLVLSKIKQEADLEEAGE